jgi:hypothetical protein
MNVNVYLHTAMYTVGPMFIPCDSPLIITPLCKICAVFEEWLLSVEVLRESIRRKRPPFICTLNSMKDIHAALQMPDSLLSISDLSGDDGT